HVERVRNYHDMYNLELFRLAAEERVPLVDITTPFLLSRDYQANLCADGIHPNAAGHRMMAEWIASRLKDRAAR
ncbi:MAG: SGNH/GDSL hydrolase family protein, partial [Paludibacteraceae bacterium]